MENVSAFVKDGCDESGDGEFVFWVSEDEAANAEEATRVKALVEALDDSEKQELQRQVRALVVSSVQCELARIPQYMQASFQDCAKVWCEQHLFKTIDDAMQQEKVLSVFRDALAESVFKLLAGDAEGRKAMIDMYERKGEKSASLLLERLDVEFQAAAEQCSGAIKSVFKRQKEKWVEHEGSAIAKSYMLNREWEITPLLQPQDAKDPEMAAKVWEAFSRAHASDLAKAVLSFNATVELRFSEFFTTVPKWMDDEESKSKCRVAFLQEQYFSLMCVFLLRPIAKV